MAEKHFRFEPKTCHENYFIGCKNDFGIFFDAEISFDIFDVKNYCLIL